ncbi:MAG: GGDEF domain-containing protein [Burkholderiales bacterium]|nr:GGDEF domain-containing protein [Burkholderiales bacterium]
MRVPPLMRNQLTPELEAQLVSQHEAEIGELLPVLGPLFGFGVIAFSIWDYLIDPAHAPLAFFLRAAFVGVGGLAYWPTKLPWTPLQRTGVIYCTHSAAIITCVYLLDGGFGYGLPAIAASCFVLSVSTLRIKTFLLFALPPFALFVFLAQLKLPVFDFFNSLAQYVFSLALAAAIMLVIRFLRQKAFLLECELTRISRHDGLTGVYNRRYLTELGEREIALARRHGRSLAALMLDIDHFKKINDSHGHDVGDSVIKAVTYACLAGVRSIDHVGRFGGEEFVCILPDAGEAEAMRCAERLRQSVEALQLPGPGDPIRFTISIGVAALKPFHESWDALLKDADIALYRAKETGRNRTVLAS